MIDFNYFGNFLNDDNVYRENIELYKKLIEKTTTEKTSEWVITKFANGKEIGGGNPIFATFIDSKKLAIRIIQTNSDIRNQIFSAWINKNPFEISGVKELVVSFQLRQDTYDDLSYLLENFINKNLSNQILRFLNNKYHKTWNEEILDYTIKKGKLNRKISEIFSNDFSKDIFTVKKLKSYASTIKKDIFPILLVDYKFQNPELNTSIRGLKNATENLYYTFTINDEIISIEQKHPPINTLIHSHYSNLGRYRQRLKKNKEKIQEELHEIEQLIG